LSIARSNDDIQRIQIDHLPPDTDEDSIRALFEPFGEVFAYERPVDEQTGVSGGIVLFRMGKLDADEAIAALNGRFIDGWTIQLTRV
jgi:hypothetical protein